jgi:hypothetical protein
MEDKIIERIFQEDVLKKEPPVLIDLGGAGGVHGIFNTIKQHCIIICIDADNRDFGSVREDNIIKITKIVSDVENKNDDFYLTASPHCSSRLKPLREKLSEYSFASLFEVTSKIQLESITLPQIIRDNNIQTVDWFKADTQGTDLRLFKSLPKALSANVIVAEFEPGILDAYDGEDKYLDVLLYMKDQPYWMDEAVIKGSKRLNLPFLAQYIEPERLNKYEAFIKDSPGWCEVSFINTFETEGMRSKRNLLLGILFSVLKKQYGFALKLACTGTSIYGDCVFAEVLPSIESFFKPKPLKQPRSLSTRINNRVKRLF